MISKEGLYQAFLRHPNVAGVIGNVVPNVGFLRRYRHMFLAMNAVANHTTIVRHGPHEVRIAPTTLCNYRCLFCEIHKDDLIHPDRSQNILSLNDIQKYDGFLANARTVAFYGGAMEPLINRDFGEIVKYLKTNYGLAMMLNTNAVPLTKKLADILVEYSFDDILVSYHAGTKVGYKFLMTGDIDRVDKNVGYLMEKRNASNSKKPAVRFNFALQRMNANETKPIIDKAKMLGVDAVVVSKYYGGYNALQQHDVAFDNNIEEGNRILDEIYSYAAAQGVELLPAKPDYWKPKPQEVQWDPDNYDRDLQCTRPWTSLHFNPDLDRDDRHYVGVCNRVELFNLNYGQKEFRTQEQFQEMWNHPLMQFLRETVNSEDDINPLCKYCKNFDRPTLRNVNQEQYGKIRDTAVKEFFAEYKKRHTEPEIEGLEVMNDNPNDNSKYIEQLKALSIPTNEGIGIIR